VLLQGRHLNHVLGTTDIKVMIGDHVECIVTSLSVSQLTCLPNTSLVEAPSGRADVVVSVYLYQFCQPYKKIYLH
jgi:hypothetical protein